jgi:hypothetical protein
MVEQKTCVAVAAMHVERRAVLAAVFKGRRAARGTMPDARMVLLRVAFHVAPAALGADGLDDHGHSFGSPAKNAGCATSVFASNCMNLFIGTCGTTVKVAFQGRQGLEKSRSRHVRLAS